MLLTQPNLILKQWTVYVCFEADSDRSNANPQDSNGSARNHKQ
ncbi:hypothetical protein T06_14615 [Trichinella sp. T6]|nr:hypothetical protein T06_14615 [Trichinella sp. T6]